MLSDEVEGLGTKGVNILSLVSSRKEFHKNSSNLHDDIHFTDRLTDRTPFTSYLQWTLVSVIIVIKT